MYVTKFLPVIVVDAGPDTIEADPLVIILPDGPVRSELWSGSTSGAAIISVSITWGSCCTISTGLTSIGACIGTTGATSPVNNVDGSTDCRRDAGVEEIEINCWLLVTTGI